MSALASLPPDFNRRRVLRTKAAAAHLGMSVATLLRKRKRGEVPAPIRLSERLLGWRIGALDDFLDCREAGREWTGCGGATGAGGAV